MMKLIALILAAVTTSLDSRDPSNPFKGLKKSDYEGFFTVDAKAAAGTGLPNCNSWKCQLTKWTATNGEKAFIAVDYNNEVDDTHCDDDEGYAFQGYINPGAPRVAYAGINLVVKKGASQGLDSFIHEVRTVHNGATIPLRLTLEYDDFLKLKSGQPKTIVSFHADIESFFVIAPATPPTVAAEDWPEKAKLFWIATDKIHADKFLGSYDNHLLIQEVTDFTTNPFGNNENYCSQ